MRKVYIPNPELKELKYIGIQRIVLGRTIREYNDNPKHEYIWESFPTKPITRSERKILIARAKIIQEPMPANFRELPSITINQIWDRRARKFQSEVQYTLEGITDNLNSGKLSEEGLQGVLTNVHGITNIEVFI